MRSLRFFYPENDPSDGDGLSSYPYTLRLSSANQYVVDVGLMGSFYGIDASSSPTPNHYIRDIQGTVYNTAVSVNAGTNGTGWVDTVSTDHLMVIRSSVVKYFSWMPEDIQSGVIKNEYMNKTATILEVKGPASSTEHAVNLFSYAGHTGVNALSGKTRVVNLGADGHGGYSVVAAPGADVIVMNSMRSFGLGTVSGSATILQRDGRWRRPLGVDNLWRAEALQRLLSACRQQRRHPLHDAAPHEPTGGAAACLLAPKAASYWLPIRVAEQGQIE